ncbi:MAG: hypothetical protein ABI831_24545, partial [Betaproteobacteria bacterium]
MPQMGDWLMVYGNIGPDPASANLVQVRRADRIVSIPPRPAGSHSIRLLGAGGVVLADYSFAPATVETGPAAAAAFAPVSSFGHVVPFVAGTQEIRIIDTAAGNAVIGAKAFSLNPPIIGNAAL